MSLPVPFTSFVVLADMRTGSNLLESNLNEFDGITCEGELFNPNFINRPDVSHVEGFDRAARDTDPLPLLAAVRARPGMNGFRFFHDHDPRILAHVLDDPACAKIVLSRNSLDSYVSLKIATTTNQWRLGHVKDRKAAKVTFDAAEFRAHAARVHKFQTQVQQQLQVSGQVAFPIAYEDLNDVAVLNGLARWLGVEATITAPSTRLKRQNPEPIEDKLTNPEALSAVSVATGGNGPDPRREPRHAPAAPMFRIASHSPLAFLPIPGGPDQKIYHWLAELDGISPQLLVTDLSIEDMRRWWQRTPGHYSFTVLRHPTARAFEIFLRHVLSGARTDVVRWLAEVEQTNLSPLDTLDDQPADVLRAEFLGFLRFLKTNRAGQTPMIPAPGWTSQVTCLRALAEVCPPRFVLKESDLVPACAQLAALAGKAAPPAPPAHTPSRRRLSRIYDASVLAATRDVYAEDFMLLGFGDWAE